MSPAGGEDPSLIVPAVPSLDAPLGDVDFPLRATLSPDSDLPISLAGRRAFAAGTPARGITEVGAHPLRLAMLRVDGTSAELVTLTPVGLERRLRVGEAPVMERVVVPREAPVCLLEWHAPEGAVELTLEWTCDLGMDGSARTAGSLRWRRSKRGLVVAGADDARAIFVFDPAAVGMDVAASDHPPGVRAGVRLRLPSGGAARLAIVGGPGERWVRRGLAAVKRPGTTGARRAHAERLLGDRLTLDGSRPESDRLDWAKVRLDAAHVELPGIGRSLLAGYGRAQRRFATVDAVTGAWAALATGDAAPARDVLSLLGRHQRESGEVPGTCGGEVRYGDPLATPSYLLLAGQLARWAGDLRTLRGAWPQLSSAVEFCRSAALEGLPRSVWELAAPLVMEAAEAIGELNAAARLRHEVGGNGGEQDGAEPDGAGSEAASGPASEGGSDAASEERMSRWAAVAAALVGGRGEPDHPEGAVPWTTASAAEVVLRLVHGLLGAEPDATRGRLVLRPRPAGGPFTVRGLLVGAAAVTLDYSRERNRHTFRVVQERGPAPLTVVLEPLLTGARLVGARVDGAAAELDARPEGDRIVVPVQLVLDHGREVVVEVE